jgi:hypothetical protein
VGHVARPQKITLAEMRSSGVRAVLIYCSSFLSTAYLGRTSGWPVEALDQD